MIANKIQDLLVPTSNSTCANVTDNILMNGETAEATVEEIEAIPLI